MATHKTPRLTNLSPGGGGGGGEELSIHTGGGVPRHLKKGGLRHRHNPQKGGLRHGHNPKKGGLRHGHKSKGGGGGLKNWSCKKDNLSNWYCTKGGFGSLFINYLYFFLVNMINWWGLLWQTKDIGVLGTVQALKGGSYARVRLDKGGVLGTGEVIKGGRYCSTYLYWTYMWVPPPPPPPGNLSLYIFEGVACPEVIIGNITKPKI